MKKRIFALFLITAMLLGLFSGCASEQFTVKFDADYVGASEISAQTVSSGKKLEAPANPSRAGYEFVGWFVEPESGIAWNFGADKVTADVTLHAVWDKNPNEPFAQNVKDKDFSKLKTPGSQEEAYEYKLNFLPAIDGISQPYVGDPMPYYEDGVYYLYYLKDQGDSYNHSVYLTTTTDFLTFTEYDDSVLEASHYSAQDSWIGTGSVCKVDNKYYFFYTGHTGSDAFEYKEKIMVAVGNDPFHFEKLEGWEMIPPKELGQKNDFRDPQVYFDAETNLLYMTVTASKMGVARVLKYTLAPDLSSYNYEGVLITNPREGVLMNNPGQSFWNLECSDCFQIGDTWYVTYSGQDDTLWYAMSDSRFGTYSTPVRLEDVLFYAPKHVSDGTNYYMVGWARRSHSPSSTADVNAWGGNLECQQLVQNPDGTLALKPIDAVVEAMNQRRELLIGGTTTTIKAGSKTTYVDVFTAYERFMLTGEFRFSGSGSFGLAFDYEKGNESKYKLITIDLVEGNVNLSFNEGSVMIAQTAVTLEKNKDYSFTYIQEGSVGVFYIDGMAALTVRLYGVTGKPVRLFAENNTVVFSCLREYTMG